MKVTYIGHTTCLIEIGGKKILTDPNWANRIAFLIKRRQAPGLELKKVLPVDLVLLSHAHLDHFDSGTLRKISKDTPIICSRNLRSLLVRRGFENIFELNWWQTEKFNNLKIAAVPAKHFGGRWWPRHDIIQYGGFVVELKNEAIYFAGDTAYFDEFKEIEERFRVDLAILPIGSYGGPGQKGFRHVHLDPAQAIQAFKDLKAGHMIPIHFGTYRLSFEPMDEPEKWLRKIVKEQNLNNSVRILEPGQAFVL